MFIKRGIKKENQMNLSNRIVTLGLMAAIGSMYGCGDKNDQQPQRPTELKREYFSDRGKIGSFDVFDTTSGTGIAVGDMDSDGDLDVITATALKIKYFENVGTRTQPVYKDWGVIGRNIATTSSGTGVALADLDNDGDLDVIIASPLGWKYFISTLPQKNKKAKISKK